MSFGEKLRALRTEKNIGQIALSKEIGVSKSIISLWELNACDPTLSNLIALAKYFGVTIDFLAGLQDY